MGVVYEVEHVHTGERLALKVIASTVEPSPQAIARFKREARVSVLIRSENVVRVTDADVAPELDGAPFLVMELLEGMDFEKAAQVSPPSPATALSWLRQVARAMDKAHRLGIVHRDLKPENLFLAQVEDRSPVVKVLDFGIAKMAQEGRTSTDSGRVLGTPKYMAPEQASANSKVTAAADLYALGLVAYRLLMGEPYYRDDNLMGILGLLLHGELELPSRRRPGFGADLDAWFARACARHPEDRFPSASAQVEALAAALGLGGESPDISESLSGPTAAVLAPPAEPIAAPRAFSGKRGGRIWLPAVALAGAVLVVGGLTVQHRTAPDHREAPLTQRTPARTAPPPAAPPPIPAAPAADPGTPPPPRATLGVHPAHSSSPAAASAEAARAKAKHSPYAVGASDRPDRGKTPAIQPPDPFRDQK